jgi:hypothetical protein
MARTLVNPHQLALFSGSTATVAKFAEGVYTGGLSMESGSVASAGTISFYDGGSIAYAGSKIQLYNNTNIEGTLTCDTSITVDSVTLTDTELGYLDGILLGTAAASKAMTLDAASDVTGARNITLSGELDAASGDFSGDIDVDGTANLDAVDIDGAVQLDGTFTVGVNDTGFDVKLFGATAGRFLLWDEDRDALAAVDNVKLEIGTGQDMDIYHDGTNSYITNKTGALKIATETNGIALTLGHSTSEVTVADNLTVAGNLTVTGTTTTVDVEVINSANGVIFEGATSDDFETTLKAVDPTADRVVQIANVAGFLVPLAAASTTAISSTPEELNLLDGVAGLVQADFTKLAAVDSTAAELNLLDGDTSVGASITVIDTDGLFINDGGVSKTIPASALKTYIGPSSGSGEVYSGTELRTSGDLRVSGSMTFGDAPARVAHFLSQVTASSGMSVFGAEGADGILIIAADEADDDADKWSLAARQDAASFQLRHGSGTAPLTIGSTGDVTVLGDLTISGDDLIMGTNTDGFIMVADGTSYNPVAVSGDVTIANTGAFTIAAQAVENSMLADDAVGADELAANAVVNASVAAGAAIAYNKMEAVTAGQIMVGNGSNVGTLVGVTGDIILSNTGEMTIGVGTVEHSMLAENIISAQDELAHADIADADDMMISDNGVVKRVGVDSLRDHFFGVVSGDVVIADGGGATIQATSVEGSMLNANVISGQTDIGGAIALTDELMVSDNGVLRKTDMSRLAAAQAGAGLADISGQLAVNFIIDSCIGSSGAGYATATGAYTCGAAAVSGSSMVFLNGQMLMEGVTLGSGDYTIATGSVELHPDLQLDADDVLRVYYLAG